MEQLRKSSRTLRWIKQHVRMCSNTGPTDCKGNVLITPSRHSQALLSLWSYKAVMKHWKMRSYYFVFCLSQAMDPQGTSRETPLFCLTRCGRIKTRFLGFKLGVFILSSWSRRMRIHAYALSSLASTPALLDIVQCWRFSYIIVRSTVVLAPLSLY